MKKLSFFLFLFSFTLTFASAQSYGPECGNIDTSDTNSVDTYTVFYGVIPPGGIYNIPAWRRCQQNSDRTNGDYKFDFKNWTPEPHHALKEVRVNFVIVQKDDGTGNFMATDSAHNAYLDSVESEINGRLRQNNTGYNCTNGGGDFCYTPSTIKDSRIQFVFNRIYWKDTYYWNNENNEPFEKEQDGKRRKNVNRPEWYANGLNAKIDSIHESVNAPAINVYFTQGDSNLRNVDSCFSDKPAFSVWTSQGLRLGISQLTAKVHITDQFSEYEWRRRCFINDTLAGGANSNKEKWPAIFGSMVHGAAGGIYHELLHQFFKTNHCDVCNSHVMNGSGGLPRDYLSKANIQEMHQALNLSKLFKFVIRKTSPSNGLETATTSDDDFIEIDSAALWDFSSEVHKDIVIRSGALLNVACTLYMPENGRIIVEPGAQLYITKGYISTLSGKFWSGIELWGNSNKNQSPLSAPTHQAKLIMSDDAVIEYAREAVQVLKPNDWSSYGGLIEAENATIRNSRRAVQFRSYKRKNNSYFKNVTFINDSNILKVDSSLFFSRVTLWDNRGAKFVACHFMDSSGINQYAPSVGNGIFSIDAAYSVLGDGTTNSSFSNFNQGIYALNSASNNSITADHTDFNNNSVGLRINSLNNVRFTNNKLVTGGVLKTGYIDTVDIGFQIGLFAFESSGYEIEGNTFEGAVNPLEEVSGVYIWKSGGEANEVYRNTFRRNTVGQFFEGDNQLMPFQGLQFLCNDNPIDNETDVEVKAIGGLQGFFEGIRPHQGNGGVNAKAAGNTFSVNPFNFQITNGSSPIIQYHDVQNKLPTLLAGPVITNAISNSNACPTKALPLDGNGGVVISLPGKIATYYSDLNTYNNLLYTYYQNLDNGNTDSLIQSINMTISSQAQQMRDNLMAQAPYVSTSALMSAAASGILSDALLLEVCLANPNATQSEGFLNYVEFQIPNPLPSNMVQLIYLSWDNETALTLLEYELADFNARLGHAANQILHYYATDTADHYDSTLSLLESRNSLESDYRRVEIAADHGDFVLCYNLLNDLQNDFVFTAEQQEEYDNFSNYIGFRDVLHAEQRSYLQLNSSEIEDLRNMAALKTGRSSALAQNILCFGYGECGSGNSSPQSRKRSLYPKREYDFTAINELESIAGIQQKFTISPNPTSEYIKVWVKNFREDQTFLLSLSNAKGQNQLQLQLNTSSTEIDISGLKKGVYIYEIREREELMEKGKLIVQ